MTRTGRTLALVMSLGLLGAAAPPQVVPWGTSGEALIIPSGAPLRFTGYDENRVARFDGNTQITGTFVYGCDIECEYPLSEGDLVGSIIPDAAVAETLPQWKVHRGGMRIYLHDAARLAAQVFSPSQRAAVASGNATSARKRVSITIEDFSATLECDSATYEARFVSLAKPPAAAMASADASYGCSWI